MTGAWAWLALIGLGLYHGANPAMGWLFAVARGMHERRASAVAGSLVPIAGGHAVSITGVVLLVGLTAQAIPVDLLRRIVAGVLIAFGAYKLLRQHAHPRWVGFRIGAPALALWSLLMATAHGAGLMLLPILLGPAGSSRPPTMADPAALGSALRGLSAGAVLIVALALLVHVFVMLLTMGVIALVVYFRVGVRILRRAWVNFELVWGAVLIISGVFLLVL